MDIKSHVLWSLPATVKKCYLFLGYQAKRVREWTSQDVEVLVSTTDVATLAGTEKLITEATALGPVGGIFHLAMVTHRTDLQSDCDYK